MILQLRGQAFPSLFILLLCASGLSGCSVFKRKYAKRADSLARKEQNKKETSTLNSGNWTNRVLVVNDSLGHHYDAQIFPKGIFHYSPSEGFTGEANSIVVKGMIRQASVMSDSLTTSSNLNRQHTLALKERDERKTSLADQVKEVKRPATTRLLWLLLLVFGVVGGGVVWWRKGGRGLVNVL